MPKVMTSYELPEEHTEFMDSYNGWRWKLSMSEMDEWLRQQIKYKDKNEFQPVRDKLYEILSEAGLKLWD